MKKVLSIDFDYFIDTTLEVRNNEFPDGEDGKQLNGVWDYFYDKYPNIAHIGLIPQYHEVLKAIDSTLSKGKVKCFVASSHKDIEKVFNDTSEDLNVTHIDFHHDCYVSGCSKLDCANWVRILKEERPNSEVLWIRREDSETTSLFGEYPYDSTTELNLSDDYDYIFMCYSPEWTPPHLKPFYNEMWARLPLHSVAYFSNY